MPNTWNIEDIRDIISRIKTIMDDARDHLIELDGAMGDGDLGITMTLAFAAASEAAETSTETNPSDLLKTIGFAIAKAAPSTMGTLLATGFMRGAKAVQGSNDLGLPELATFFQAFVQGIMDRGKAKPGDKTIIDVLWPVAQSLSQAAESHQHETSLLTAMANAYDIAQQAILDTTRLKAQHGRAAYYQDASIGRQDAGSVVGLLIIKAFYEHSISG
jgi:phosphoenolpyruvate---glycerone phosphotransferase subunit DhaL